MENAQYSSYSPSVPNTCSSEIPGLKVHVALRYTVSTGSKKWELLKSFLQWPSIGPIITELFLQYYIGSEEGGDRW